MYGLIPISQCIPPPLPSFCNHKFTFCICVYFCFVNTFICIGLATKFIQVFFHNILQKNLRALFGQPRTFF